MIYTRVAGHQPRALLLNTRVVVTMTRGLLASTREYEYDEWCGYEYMTSGPAGRGASYMCGLVSQEARLSARGGGTMRSGRCGGTADLVSYLYLVPCTYTGETYMYMYAQQHARASCAL